jgi:hypothetical protein
MNPELEALLKAWDSYQQDKDGKEARELRSLYEALVERIAVARKRDKRTIDRLVKHSYRRWQQANSPTFPSYRQEHDMTPYH